MPLYDNDEDASRYLKNIAARLPDTFLKFARALDRVGAFNNVDGDDIHYFLENPWKWSKAFAVWQSVGQPMSDEDPDDVSGWNRFMREID